MCIIIHNGQCFGSQRAETARSYEKGRVRGIFRMLEREGRSNGGARKGGRFGVLKSISIIEYLVSYVQTLTFGQKLEGD